MDEETPGSPRLIRDLMSVGVATCSCDTPVIDLVRAFLEKDLEGVVVLDENGHAVGVVSRDEMICAYGRGDFENWLAEDVMRDGVPQVPPDIPLNVAAQIMQDMGVRILFLMHHAGGIEYPAAFISYTHLLRHMAAEDGDELRDLGIKAERESPLETFIRRRDDARRRARFDE